MRAPKRARSSSALAGDAGAVLLAAGDHGQAGHGRDLPGTVPALEAHQHVGADDQPEGRARLLALHLAQRVHRVARPLAPQLEVADLAAGQTGKGQPAHLEPLLRGGAALRQLLVRRQVIGHDQQPIRLQHAQAGARRLDMAEMRRVEGSSEDRQPHGRR
jgi:hypothetical protein